MKLIAVIFEVELKDQRANEYLDIATALKTELNNVDGFIAVERFQSLSYSNKYLSLSLWRDLESIEGWKRNKRLLSGPTLELQKDKTLERVVAFYGILKKYLPIFIGEEKIINVR